MTRESSRGQFGECSRPIVVFAACVAFLALTSRASGQGADLPHRALEKGNAWALLVGCEGYTAAPPLRYTINDVVQLSETLEQRGGLSAERILKLTDDAAEPKLRPVQKNMLEQIPQYLSQLGPDDQLLVYFSGHGFRNADNRMFLAPLDCNPRDPAATGVPVEWLREQIAACPARFKLLILDACHAGSEKGDKDESLATAKDLGEPFRDLAGVVTLASSTGEEKSQLWDEKRQSLFSYWLNQALKGHADQNGDGDVDIDELNGYVHRNVTHTAQERFSRPQTPVRIVRSGTPGVPVAVRLQPQSLKQVISDMAEELAWALEEHGQTKVGVLEFTNDTKLGELLGADFGLLGRYCAEELERQLIERGGQKFSVVDRRRLQAALQKEEISVASLGDTEALRSLSKGAGGMPVIALGTLRNRLGRVVNLQCQLVETEGDAIVGTAGGTAWLNESEWAMLGKSVAVRPDDRRPPLPGAEKLGETQTDRVVEKLDDHADAAHPMLDPKFPYRVNVKVGNELRKPVYKGNDMFVPVRKGETFELVVENKSGQVAMMRLLVDGLNTLPQKADVKGVQTYEVAKRVNLDEARGWVLDPEVAEKFTVSGFVTETGAQGKLREFLVVDADQSLAARKSFTDQLGLITAAFYAPGGSRSVGVDLGDEREQDLTERRDKTVGNLLAVVNVRYVDADTLSSDP